MRWTLGVLVIAVSAACSDNGSGPDPVENPPAEWAVFTDTTEFVGTLIAEAEVTLELDAAVSLSFGCAQTIGDTDAPPRSMELKALTTTFGDPPFIVAVFRPDSGTGGLPWGRGFQGHWAHVNDTDADDAARRALAADSVSFTWSTGGTARERVFDTRALPDVFGVLTEVCGWSP